jgi:1-acyl-sn-glycerol-3-phosphate acyltransferase
MTRQLEGGRKIAIFAEGGILPGAAVKRFHARLFGAAIDSGKPVQPVMLRYLRAGRPYHDITFLPNERFLHNFFRLLCQPACTAEVVILPLINPAGTQRRSLASEAQAAVAAAFSGESLR